MLLNNDLNKAGLILDDADSLLSSQAPPAGSLKPGTVEENINAAPASQQETIPMWQLCSLLLREAPGLKIVVTCSAWSEGMHPYSGAGFDVQPRAIAALDTPSSLALLQLHGGDNLESNFANQVVKVDRVIE